MARNEGLFAQRRVWSQAGQKELMALSLSPWAAVRRQDWQELLGELNRRIEPLDRALKQQAEQQPEIRLLMTHPGVGPVTATAFVLTLGEPRAIPDQQTGSRLSGV